jgi:hypothetical protein
MRRGEDQALRDVVAIEGGLAGAEIVAGVTNAIRKRDLADVVHQRADAEFHQHRAGTASCRASSSEIDVTFIECAAARSPDISPSTRRQGSPSTSILSMSARASILRVGVASAGSAEHLVRSAAQVAAGLVELALAAQRAFALRRERGLERRARLGAAAHRLPAAGVVARRSRRADRGGRTRRRRRAGDGSTSGSLRSGLHVMRASPSERIVSICSSAVILKLESGNGCDIHRRSGGRTCRCARRSLRSGASFDGFLPPDAHAISSPWNRPRPRST